MRLELLSARTARGVQTSLEVALPQGLTYGIFRIPRDNWRVRAGDVRTAEVIDCSIEISFDAGRSWQFFVGFSAPGGDLFDRRGDLIVESCAKINLPRPDADRMVRAVVNCKDRLAVQLNLDAE